MGPYDNWAGNICSKKLLFLSCLQLWRYSSVHKGQFPDGLSTLTSWRHHGGNAKNHISLDWQQCWLKWNGWPHWDDDVITKDSAIGSRAHRVLSDGWSGPIGDGPVYTARKSNKMLEKDWLLVASLAREMMIHLLWWLFNLNNNKVSTKMRHLQSAVLLHLVFCNGIELQQL